MSRRPNKYPSAKNEKQKDIQMIHIAKQQLGMDEETYRSMLWTVARVKSSTELDFVGRRNVIAHLEARGFKRTRPARKLADDPQSKKIRALWLDLHKAEKVRNPSEEALAAFVKRQTGCEALQWLSGKQASDVIEELKKWLER